MVIKHGNKVADQKKSPFILPNLPYADTALEPHMTAKTFSFHHGKHHAAYVNNLNKLIAGTELEHKSLEEIIGISASDSSKAAIFNNAAQVWNHTFFWHSMTPNGGGEPSGKLMDAITENFGSFEKLTEEFKNAATTQFGSGWAWLVTDGKKLKILKTANADTPITQGYKALVTCDVWEHSYYLDYQNKRPDYVDIFLKHLINWKFVAENFNG